MLKTPTARAWAALLAAISAALAVRPFAETDIYWHLALGRAVLRHHSRVVPEPMALDAAGTHCVASEWLWEVIAAALHTRPGDFAAITALTALFAALCAALVVALCHAPRRDGARADGGALGLAAALALSLVTTRMRLRPESAALVLLPAVALLARRHADALDAGAPTAWRHGAGLALLLALWAQLHPSTPIGLAAWGATLLPTAVRALREARTADARRRLATIAAVAAAMVAAMATGAHGVGVLTQWRLHAGGDAVRHIADMRAPPVGFFDPRETPFGVTYLAMLAAGAAGMLVARRAFVRELLLALPGLALVATAVRGVGPAAVLTAPLAARGLGALVAAVPRPASRRGAGRAAGLLAIAVVALAARRLWREEGPLGAVGPRPGSMPHASARFLARHAARPVPVLASFLGAAPLGYWLPGRVRTLVDSRTPMHFSDADYGRARDIWRIPRALDLATERYGFVAAVAERDGPECPVLAASPRWRAVVAEASFTTFVRADAGIAAPMLRRIAPCGADHLAPDACGDDRGGALGVEVARMRELGARQAAPFHDYLDALRVVRCGAQGVATSTLRRWLRSRDETRAFGPQRDRVLAAVLLADGDIDGALDLVEEAVRGGDLQSLGAVINAARRHRPERLRGMLEALSRASDDFTPGDVRAELASLCAAEGDAACVRFEGLRAAALGSARAGPALCWLEANHPQPHVRRDATRWLRTLALAIPGDPRLRCPPR